VQLEMEVPEAHTPGTYSLTVTMGGEVLQEQEVEVLDEGPQLLLETDKPGKFAYKILKTTRNIFNK
jgi:hypothetical protein